MSRNPNTDPPSPEQPETPKPDPIPLPPDAPTPRAPVQEPDAPPPPAGDPQPSEPTRIASRLFTSMLFARRL